MTDSSSTFKKTIGGILAYKENSHAWKALSETETTDIESFLTLDENDIEKLSYKDEDGGVVSLTAAHHKKLICLRRWAHSKGDEGTLEETWTTLNKQEFAKFFNSPAARVSVIPPPPAPVPAVFPAAATATATNTEATGLIDAFKKGMRREVKDYNVLDDQSKFLSWHLDVITTAHAQGVYDVLDDTVNPSTPAGQELLKLQGDFMYKVFNSTVKLAQGKWILHQHAVGSDGRAVWVALNQTYANGVAGELLSSQIEGQLITMRLYPSWNKTLQAYLTLWESKITDLMVV